MTASPRCPICRAPVTPPGPDPAPASPPPPKSWFPFCSERCQLVDLGRWLSGQYAIPGQTLHDQTADEVPEGES